MFILRTWKILLLLLNYLLLLFVVWVVFVFLLNEIDTNIIGINGYLPDKQQLLLNRIIVAVIF